MSLRRFLALALLVPLLGPSVAAFEDLAQSDAHACADGLCRCTHGRPSAPAPAPCHGSKSSAPDCWMSARCSHEDTALPGTQSRALIPEARQPAVEDLIAAAPTAPAGAVRIGHSRIDSPPPRPA
jgi:hypothetical protein